MVFRIRKILIATTMARARNGCWWMREGGIDRNVETSCSSNNRETISKSKPSIILIYLVSQRKICKHLILFEYKITGDENDEDDDDDGKNEKLKRKKGNQHQSNTMPMPVHIRQSIHKWLVIRSVSVAFETLSWVACFPAHPFRVMSFHKNWQPQ